MEGEFCELIIYAALSNEAFITSNRSISASLSPLSEKTQQPGILQLRQIASPEAERLGRFFPNGQLTPIDAREARQLL